MPFSASRALSESFDIFSKKFGTMLPIAAILNLLPLLVFLYFFGSSFAGMAGNQGDPTAALGVITAMAGRLALVYIVYALIRTVGVCAMCIAAGGRGSLSVGDAIGEGIKVLLPMLGVYLLLLVGYIVVVIVLALTVGLSFIGALTGGGRAMGAGAGLTLMLLIPALLVLICYVASKLSMVMPVVALDKERNPVTAISRSWSLTKGATLKIFGVFVLIVIAMAVINGVASALTGGMRMDPTAGMGPGFFVSIVVSAIFGTLFGMYFVALLVAIHNQLAGPTTAAVSDTFS